MSTVVNFGGNQIIEPGVYAQILSGIPARPSNNSFGNICIIDTGSGALWGGGSGVNGQLANGLGSVYAFNDLNDFQAFVRGGLLWDLAPYIFDPASGANGPETVYLVRAAETTSPDIDFTFVGGGANGGFVKFICKNEGLGGNGFEDEILAKGKVDVGGVIVPGDTYQLLVDEGSGPIPMMLAVIAITASATDLRSLIIDAINAHALGYSAYEQAGEVIICARQKSGINANTWPITSVIVGTITDTITALANGVDGTQLATGYGAEMSIGEDDPLKFMIRFYEGTFRGNSPGKNPYSGLSAQDSPPNLIATSIEFDNIDDLIQWAKNDFNFNKRFIIDDNWIINGTGAVDSADLTTYSDLNLAIGGTEDYAADDLDKVLEDIKELDNTFFLADRFGEEAKGVQNTKIWNHIQDGAEFDKFMIVGGGIDETKFDTDPNSSIEVAKYYNSESVVLVHSGHKRQNVVGSGTEKLPSLYHASNVSGRLGGLEPQTPITFKNLLLSDFNHNMGQKEREKALQAGVLHNRFVPGIGNVVNQGINTLQRNLQLINPDGTSFEISVMRIGAQLNKEMVLNMRPLFVGNNIGSATPADVKVFVEGLLISRTATDLTDNLIISFKNVTVRLVEDYYEIKYGFVPNGPINKLFITGFMLDANLTA